MQIRKVKDADKKYTNEKYDPFDLSTVSLEPTKEDEERHELSVLLGKMKYYWKYGDRDIKGVIGNNFKVDQPLHYTENGNPKIRPLRISIK